MKGKKPWYTSTTIQGVIILAVTIIAGKMNLDFGDSEKSMLKEIIVGAGEFVGLVMTFWGRIKATETVSLS